MPLNVLEIVLRRGSLARTVAVWSRFSVDLGHAFQLYRIVHVCRADAR